MLEQEIKELQQLNERIGEIIAIIEDVMSVPFSEWGFGECKKPQSQENCVCREIFLWNVNKSDMNGLVPHAAIARHLRRKNSYRPSVYVKQYDRDYATNFIMKNGTPFREVADAVREKVFNDSVPKM